MCDYIVQHASLLPSHQTQRQTHGTCIRFSQKVEFWPLQMQAGGRTMDLL